MYVRAGRPAFARPCVGVHKSTSLMSSSLLKHFTLGHMLLMADGMGKYKTLTPCFFFLWGWSYSFAGDTVGIFSPHDMAVNMNCDLRNAN